MFVSIEHILLIDNDYHYHVKFNQ